MTETAIDPSLSVYNLVMRTREQRTILNHRRTMLAISREIEHVVMHDRVKARVFSGFQRMSRFEPQVDRYRELARHAESVYVFGFPDVVPPPINNVRYIYLNTGDQLVREWFLIAEAPDFFTGLATEEVGRSSVLDGQPVFQGVWTFDEDMVNILQEWLSSLVAAQPLVDLKQRRSYRRQIAYMSDMMGRLTARLAQTVEQPSPGGEVARQEIHTAVDTQLIPALHKAEDQRTP